MTNKSDMVAEILKAMDDLKKSGLLEEIEDQANANSQGVDDKRSGGSHEAEPSKPRD